MVELIEAVVIELATVVEFVGPVVVELATVVQSIEAVAFEVTPVPRVAVVAVVGGGD